MFAVHHLWRVRSIMTSLSAAAAAAAAAETVAMLMTEALWVSLLLCFLSAATLKMYLAMINWLDSTRHSATVDMLMCYRVICYSEYKKLSRRRETARRSMQVINTITHKIHKNCPTVTMYILSFILHYRKHCPKSSSTSIVLHRGRFFGFHRSR